MHDARWSELDLWGIAELWDSTDRAPIYIGEEYSAPLIGWADLNKHWGRLGSRLQAASVRSRLVSLKHVPPLVIAVLLSEWSFVGVESDLRHDGRSWVTALVRQTDRGWRFIHYMETSIFLGEGIDLPQPRLLSLENATERTDIHD